jgi:hypothetical protein
MANWMDPAAALATNPYLLLQPPASPDKWTLLGNLLMGAGVGIGQAEAAGRGWASGIAPGLMTGLQMSNAMHKQAEDQSLRRAQLAMMLGNAPQARALGAGSGRMSPGPADASKPNRVPNPSFRRLP